MFGRPNVGRDQTPRNSSSAGLSLDELPSMADAGVKVVDCIHDSYVPRRHFDDRDAARKRRLHRVGT